MFKFLTDIYDLMLLFGHTRYLLLFQGLVEDQQQGLGPCFGSSKGKEPAAGERDREPSETSGGFVLRAGHKEVHAQKIGWFIVFLSLYICDCLIGALVHTQYLILCVMKLEEMKVLILNK